MAGMKIDVPIRNLLFYVFIISSFNPLKTKSESQGSIYEVIVDLTTSVGEMRRIWDNTGLSPPAPGSEAVEYLTSKEQKVNLALIGSLPFKGLAHVRIHWLLDLITVNFTDGGNIKYNYHLLDELMHWLKQHRLIPGFELMGNPGGLFSDLNSNPDTVVLWQNFVIDLGSHYIGLFGIEEVRKWRFELWNEPDSKQYNILNLTTPGYLRYALASIKGLRVNGIKVSGPAGTFRDIKHHNISWSLLQMCESMISQTGRCDLDTITFHKKGEGVAQNVVSYTTEFLFVATSLYPHLKTMSFANNEADILSGWWREEEWRGDVNYAAAVCEVLTSFLSQNTSLAYISNDNGFINQPPAYFNQRTLLTRFQMNKTADRPSQFIRKPVMITMALLSYLGPKLLPVFHRPTYNSINCSNRLSVLAGAEEKDTSWRAAVVLAVSQDLTANCSDTTTVNLILKLPPITDMIYVVYQLDNVLTNPKDIWERNGRPDFPDGDILRQMRTNEGPYVSIRRRIGGGWKNLFLQLRIPSVTLIHFCARPEIPPAKIDQFHAINVTYNEVLLVWQDASSRCLQTYEVYFCKTDCLSDKDYCLITNDTILMLAYQYRAVSSPDDMEATRGHYKVRARDYWDQVGNFSDILVY